MKIIDMRKTTLDACVEDAQSDRVVLEREGRPVALILGVQGMDEEQVRSGQSDALWRLITQRRQQKTITRAELEKRIGNHGADR